MLARSLALYQTRNGGQLPKRIPIHKTTAFKDSEIEGAFDTLPVSPVYVTCAAPSILPVNERIEGVTDLSTSGSGPS